MRFAVPHAFRLALLAGFATAALGLRTALAAEPLSFTVPGGDSDGYGIAECLQTGMECGRVMAEALCESHGHAHVAAFGAAADVTGSVPSGHPVVQAAADEIMIRCSD